MDFRRCPPSSRRSGPCADRCPRHSVAATERTWDRWTSQCCHGTSLAGEPLLGRVGSAAPSAPGDSAVAETGVALKSAARTNPQCSSGRATICHSLPIVGVADSRRGSSSCPLRPHGNLKGQLWTRVKLESETLQSHHFNPYLLLLRLLLPAGPPGPSDSHTSR